MNFRVWSRLILNAIQNWNKNSYSVNDGLFICDLLLLGGPEHFDSRSITHRDTISNGYGHTEIQISEGVISRPVWPNM